MRANIFNIQRYSTGDGRGIRTTVFFKGCMLFCPWCHNPESISFKQQLMYYENLCTNCGLCKKQCKNNVHYFIDGKHKVNMQNCVVCGKCTDMCLNALRIAGYETDIEEIEEEIMQDISYYKLSNGGVTFSGGEPLLQADAVCQIMQDLEKEDINFTIDTSLVCDKESLKKTLKCNTYLVDIKSADEKKFKEICGGELNTVINNINYLISENKEIILRIPLIPEFNISEEDTEKIIKLIKPFNLPTMLLPYHNLGKSKYKALGTEYNCNVKLLSEEQLNKIKQKYSENVTLLNTL